MRTWTDTIDDLGPGDDPIVCVHTDNVSLSLPGYMTHGDGRGFTLRLTTAHLPVLHTLVQALEQLSLQQGEEAPVEEQLPTAAALVGQQGLCPECGQQVTITTTTMERCCVIGSCLHAFTVQRW